MCIRDRLESDWEAYSLEMLEKAKAKGVKLLLPVDTVIADAFSPDANSKVCLLYTSRCV